MALAVAFKGFLVRDQKGRFSFSFQGLGFVGVGFRVWLSVDLRSFFRVYGLGIFRTLG